MIRTQIQLPEAEYEALKAEAHRVHRSMADCVREAVSAYLSRARAVESGFAAVAGKFRPLPLNDLKPHDRMWAESMLGRDSSCEKSS